MKKPNEMSDEELLKNKKILQVITYMLAGVLLLLFIINLITTIKKGFTALFAVPFALMPIVVLNLNNIKEINKELKTRNQS